MKRASKEPPKAVNIFSCVTCANGETMSPSEAKEHLKTVHGIENAKGTRSMVLHLDCADHFVFQFEWKIGNVTLDQHTSTPRKGFDGRYLNPR